LSCSTIPLLHSSHPSPPQFNAGTAPSVDFENLTDYIAVPFPNAG